MNLHRHGKLVWGVRTGAPDVQLALLVGYGDRRLRAEYGRVEHLQGWQRRVASLHIWKLMRYGIYTNSREYFEHRWVL